ncbi:MAG: hypothetical protein ACYDA4_05695 [Ignavibacteriaceae bacterium]
MIKYNIGLVNIGENLPVNLDSLVKKLNKLQNIFIFNNAFSISVDKIGKPDREQWYDYRKLILSISNESRSDNFDYLIGLTRFPITDIKEFEELQEVDYFSQSDYKKHCIISISPSVKKYLSKDKDWYQYVAYTLMCELLIVMCKKDLSHPEQKLCLFDECDNRIEIQACMDKGIICDQDKYIIRSIVDPQIVPEVEKILNWCRIKRWRTALKNTIVHPLVTLYIGAALGSLNYFFILSCIPIILLSMVSFRYFSKLKK